MTLDDLSAIVETLPGARSGNQGGRRRWTLRGRLLAREIDQATVVIRTDFAAREDFLSRHPSTFTVSERFENHMMMLADLRRGDPAAIAEALQAAYRLQSQD